MQYKGREGMYLWLKTDNMEIQEGNEIIAKYLGWFKEDDEYDTWFMRSDNCIVVAWSSYKHPFKELPFHKDWNQLIPVVKRVQKELWELALPHPQSMVANTLRNVVAELDMKLIWEWVIVGIELINEIKAKEDGTK